MERNWSVKRLDGEDLFTCSICGAEFHCIGKGHFNMRVLNCPLCKQEVWVPRCPKGCPSFVDSSGAGRENDDGRS